MARFYLWVRSASHKSRGSWSRPAHRLISGVRGIADPGSRASSCVTLRRCDRVRARRQKLGWSQETLALKAGINRTYIATLESGRRNPSLELIARLAAAMKVDAGDLVQGLERLKGR